MRHKFLVLTLCTALGFSATSCRNDINSSKSATPIQLGVKVDNTKAPVSEGSDFSASILGWEVVANAQPDYKNSYNWMTSADITASSVAAQTGILLATPQFYPYESQSRTYIKGVSPSKGECQNGIFSFDLSAGNFSTGDVDVMVTDEVSGSKSDNGVKNLVFRHLLSQIKFAIVTNITSVPAVTLQSIKIIDAQLPSGVDLTTNKVVGSAPAPLSVPMISGNEAFTTTPVLVSQPVMVVPFAGNSFKVDVLTSLGAKQSITITTDDRQNFTAGRIYTITLKQVVTNTTSEIVFDKVVTTDWILGNSIVENVEDVPVVGKYADGGIVYWVDPANSKHYKVVSLFEPTARDQASAKAYCLGYGAGWHLPTAVEAAEFSTVYQTNKADIDNALALQYGTPFGPTLYWIDSSDPQNSINMATGVLSSSDVSTPLAVRAIKEVRF